VLRFELHALVHFLADVGRLAAESDADVRAKRSGQRAAAGSGTKTDSITPGRAVKNGACAPIFEAGPPRSGSPKCFGAWGSSLAVAGHSLNCGM
jgi:hypothetical protein